jgi:hypothetical protein
VQHCARLRTVAHHIAQADDLIDARVRDVSERSFQRDKICVNIGNERDSHLISPENNN